MRPVQGAPVTLTKNYGATARFHRQNVKQVGDEDERERIGRKARRAAADGDERFEDAVERHRRRLREKSDEAKAKPASNAREAAATPRRLAEFHRFWDRLDDGVTFSAPRLNAIPECPTILTPSIGMGWFASYPRRFTLAQISIDEGDCSCWLVIMPFYSALRWRPVFDAAKTERGKLQWNARSRMECCQGCHAEVLHTFQYSSV